MAFGIDLDRVQREAEFQLKIYNLGQRAIKDLQTQAQVERTGGDPDWWGGGSNLGEPQFGLGGKGVLPNDDEDSPKVTMSEETRKAMTACPIDGYNGKPGIWVWTDEANFIGHCTEDTSSSSSSDSGGASVADPYLSFQKEKGITSAKAMMKGFLNQFGLGGAVHPDGSVDPDITKWALGMPESGLDGDAIIFEMRYGTADPAVRAAYDSVFPAMAARRKAGYSAITEIEYINLTRGYTQIATAAGIDPDFLAGAGKTVAADGITALIAGDVSLAEWRDRVDLAEWSVTTIDPYAKGILQTTYGYTDQDLAMHFLDPTRAASVKKAQQDVGGAKIISAGVTSTGGMLGRDFADYAYGQDIQAREVVAGLSPYGALTGDTLYEEGMSPDEIAWGRFGSSEQRNKLRRGTARRTSPFQGVGGSLVATSAGVIGAGAVSN